MNDTYRPELFHLPRTAIALPFGHRAEDFSAELREDRREFVSTTARSIGDLSPGSQV
ncbi:hypothetical protein ACFV6F_30765 [Kitasatospora phosalacinea]|uniref:hypothetical protein n=1 Tax=Kitasatospora phosalacinea TaxID=2065 RepID=UPI00365B1B73